MGEQPDNYEVLKTPIPTDDPLSIMKIASESEALSYQVATKLLSCENQLAAIEHRITVERMRTIVDNSGDKVAVSASKADAAVAALKEKADLLEASIKYYKYVGRLIESRCSLSQTFLANLTVQIKSGLIK